ncbi:hypothetical protein [Consotaella aegiceratis]|uniref:hypothetical protein n=1 Tax=Consotaella aegiceratis TaxID=3097961 RepID=UPI002F3FB1D1
MSTPGKFLAEMPAGLILKRIGLVLGGFVLAYWLAAGLYGVEMLADRLLNDERRVDVLKGLASAFGFIPIVSFGLPFVLPLLATCIVLEATSYRSMIGHVALAVIVGSDLMLWSNFFLFNTLRGHGGPFLWESVAEAAPIALVAAPAGWIYWRIAGRHACGFGLRTTSHTSTASEKPMVEDR